MEKPKLHVAVPTSTIIAHLKGNKRRVAVFRSTGKHDDKLVLPGGRLKVGKQNWVEAGNEELSEELNLSTDSLEFFALSSKVDRDVRNMTKEKFLDGREDVPELDTFQIIGHYTFDVSFIAAIEDASTLKVDGDEGKDAFWIDVMTVDPEDFALDHGHLLVAYREYLETGKKPTLDQF